MREKILKEWPLMIPKLLGWAFALGGIYQQFQSLSATMSELKNGLDKMQTKVAQINETLVRQDEQNRMQNWRLDQMSK